MIFQESETVELKMIVVEDIKKEIIAFANTKGGKLYIGVRDDGAVIGLTDPDGASLQISNMVRDAIKPDVTMFLHYEILELEGKKILTVDVQQGTQRPYYLAKNGMRPEGVFIRQGFSSTPASTFAIRAMIKETDGEHYEELRSMEQGLSFQAATKEFEARNIPFGETQMKTLGILNRDGIYTNLGALLSDQCIHTIKVACFQGNDQNIFKDRREFSGSLFQQMEDVYSYIDFRNPVHATFQKLRRLDVRDYPEVAVREALLNCLVHREYSIRASTLISLYDDRMEFTSIGGLVEGVSLSDIQMGVSVCRNRLLANVFYRLELIEAHGTGIKKILGAYEGTGRQPTLEVSDNAFKITLPNRNISHEAENIRDSRSDASEAVLSMAREQGRITRKEIEVLLGVGQTTCGRLLRQMTDEGILVQEGKGRNTFYRIC